MQMQNTFGTELLNSYRGSRYGQSGLTEDSSRSFNLVILYTKHYTVEAVTILKKIIAAETATAAEAVTAAEAGAVAKADIKAVIIIKQLL